MSEKRKEKAWERGYVCCAYIPCQDLGRADYASIIVGIIGSISKMSIIENNREQHDSPH